MTLYQHLLLYPQEIIPIMDMVINDVFEEKFPDVAVAPQGIQVRPYNLEKTTNMRDLNPSGAFPAMARARAPTCADAHMPWYPSGRPLPADIDGYVAIKGLVIRVSNVIPDLKLGAHPPLRQHCESTRTSGHSCWRCCPVAVGRPAAYFECLKCNASVTVPVDRGRVEEPTRCANCSSMRSMNHVYNRCTYADKQVIRLQETPGPARRAPPARRA